MSYSTTCAACGSFFDAARPSARTCSEACRSAMYRRRRTARSAGAAEALVSGLRGDAAAFVRGLDDALDLLRPPAA